MKFSIRPAAREDILRQYRYYLLEENAAQVAERFLAAVEQTVHELCQHPRMGSPRFFKNPALEGLRTWPVKSFPAIRIYYLCDEEAVRVVRVLHGKRDIDPLLEAEEEGNNTV